MGGSTEPIELDTSGGCDADDEPNHSFTQRLHSILEYSANPAVQSSYGVFLARPPLPLSSLSQSLAQPLSPVSPSQYRSQSFNTSMCSPPTLPQSFYTYQLNALARPITYPTLSTAGLDMHKRKAKTLFTRVRTVMERERGNDSHSAVSDIVALCQQHPSLHDEFVAQLVKQCTKNPSHSSLTLGLRLVVAMLIYIRPTVSEPVMGVLLSLAARYAPVQCPTFVRQYHSTSDCAVLIHTISVMAQHASQPVPAVITDDEALKMFGGDSLVSVSASKRSSIFSSDDSHLPPSSPFLASDRSSMVFSDNALFTAAMSTSNSARSSLTTITNTGISLCGSIVVGDGKRKTPVHATAVPLLTLPAISSLVSPSLSPPSRTVFHVDQRLGLDVAGEFSHIHCDDCIAEPDPPSADTLYRACGSPVSGMKRKSCWLDIDVEALVTQQLLSNGVPAAPSAMSQPPPDAPPLSIPFPPPIAPPLTPPVALPLISPPSQAPFVCSRCRQTESDDSSAPPPLAPPLFDVPCAPSMNDVPCAPPVGDVSRAPPMMGDDDVPAPPLMIDGPPAAPPLGPPSAGQPRNDIMAAIKAAQTKKSQAAAPAADPRAALMDAIRNGAKLRKAGAASNDVPDAPPPPSATASASSRDDLLAAIRAGPRLRKVGARAADISSSPDVPPAPPTAPAAPKLAASADPRDDLLAAIRAGPKLRKVGVAAAIASTSDSINIPPPPPLVPAVSSGNPRDDLLSAIRAGPKLRKVTDNISPPAAPSMNSSIPSPPPITASAASSSTDPRSDMLAAIRGGVKLRKATSSIHSPTASNSEAPAPPPISSSSSVICNPRDDLLAAIRAGPRLRKVTAPVNDASEVPTAPTMSATAPAATSSDSRCDLLSAIRGGIKLRKIAPNDTSDVPTSPANAPPSAPARSTDLRNDMLSAIRGGVKLKKVEVSEPAEIPRSSVMSIPAAPPASALRAPSQIRPGSAPVTSFDLHEALSSHMFRRHSRMKYDTIKPGQISPLSESLTSSPTSHSRLRNLEEVLEMELDDDVVIGEGAPPPPLPLDELSPPLSADVPAPPPLAAPSAPRSGIAEALRAAKDKKAAMESTGLDPRDELLAAIQGGAKLRKVSSADNNSSDRPPGSRSMSQSVEHSRHASVLDDVVAAASYKYHNRMQSVSVSSSNLHQIVRSSTAGAVAPQPQPPGKPDWMLALKSKQAIHAHSNPSHAPTTANIGNSAGPNSELSAKLKVRQETVNDSAHQIAGATSELAVMLARRQQKLSQPPTQSHA